MKDHQPNAETNGVRRSFDETFKRNAVNLTLRGERPVRQIAQELGVGEGLLHRWRRKYAPGPSGATAIKQAQTPEQKDELIAWQAAEIVRLREREIILKKSLGILSETPESGMPKFRK